MLSHMIVSLADRWFSGADLTFMLRRRIASGGPCCDARNICARQADIIQCPIVQFGQGSPGQLRRTPLFQSVQEGHEQIWETLSGCGVLSGNYGHDDDPCFDVIGVRFWLCPAFRLASRFRLADSPAILIQIGAVRI